MTVPARIDATVLVTGVGGPAGLAVARSLIARGVGVVLADADPTAVGLRFGPERIVLPRSDEDGFADAVVAAATGRGCSAVVVTVAEELRALAAREEELEAAGVGTWFPSADALDRCLDKWRFAQTLRAAGVPTPPTALATANGIPGPWIVKPRNGRGSRDVHAVDSRRDVTWACRHVPDPLVQQRCRGREFTVDALVDRDGTLVGAVPRWRIETRAGISTKGLTFTDPAVLDVTARALDAVGLRGVANVQGFLDRSGAATVVEVNPRFSGGLPLSLAAGADLVGEYVRVLHGMPVQPERLAFAPGVAMVRYLESVFVRP